MTTACGRTTAKGTACRLPVAAWWWIREDRRDRLPHSCASHLRGGELELYRATRERHEARRRAAEERWRASEPACWSWPVPDDLAAWGPPGAADLPAGVRLPQETADSLAAFDRSPAGRAGALLVWWQAGRCALCAETRMRLVEDHDHVSGLVRGLLCHGCNTREGLYGEDDTSFGRYRAKHPTLILGIEMRYWDPIGRAYAPDRRGDPPRDPWDPQHNALIGLGL